MLLISVSETSQCDCRFILIHTIWSQHAKHSALLQMQRINRDYRVTSCAYAGVLATDKNTLLGNLQLLQRLSESGMWRGDPCDNSIKITIRTGLQAVKGGPLQQCFGLKNKIKWLV